MILPISINLSDVRIQCTRSMHVSLLSSLGKLYIESVLI